MLRAPSRSAALPLLLLLLVACSEEGGSGTPAPGSGEAAAGDGGRWRPARGAAHDGDEGDDAAQRLEELRAIGYASGSEPAEARSGVLLHEPARSFAGPSFYTSGHGPCAVLIDHEGRVLHEWRRAFQEVWPGDDEPAENHNRGFWRRALLLEDGSLIAIFEGLGVFRIDRDSRLVWAARNGAHHDLHLLPSGELWVLTRVAHVVPRVDPDSPILEDFLTLLDAEGRELRRISLLEAFERGGHERIWRASRDRIGDVFHTNTLHLLDGTAVQRLPELSAGRILTASPRLDLVALVDPDEERVVRIWRAGFFGLHDPRLLPSGNLLVFDNHGDTGASRVVELDPADSSVVWEYRGTPEQPFFSKACGAAQRLPNGNTLVTESDNGRAFEVAPDGEIVWEFLSPHRAGERGELVATLFELVRLEPDFPTAWARPPDR